MTSNLGHLLRCEVDIYVDLPLSTFHASGWTGDGEPSGRQTNRQANPVLIDRSFTMSQPNEGTAGKEARLAATLWKICETRNRPGLWQRAPAAFRVRVWQITSWGRGPRGGRSPPEGANVADPLLSAPFPLGNLVAGIIAAGHPWWHRALGGALPIRLLRWGA
jgi:hypothetical protein